MSCHILSGHCLRCPCIERRLLCSLRRLYFPDSLLSLYAISRLSFYSCFLAVFQTVLRGCSDRVGSCRRIVYTEDRHQDTSPCWHCTDHRRLWAWAGKHDDAQRSCKRSFDLLRLFFGASSCNFSMLGEEEESSFTFSLIMKSELLRLATCMINYIG